MPFFIKYTLLYHKNVITRCDYIPSGDQHLVALGIDDHKFCHARVVRMQLDQKVFVPDKIDQLLPHTPDKSLFVGPDRLLGLKILELGVHFGILGIVCAAEICSDFFVAVDIADKFPFERLLVDAIDLVASDLAQRNKVTDLAQRKFVMFFFVIDVLLGLADQPNAPIEPDLVEHLPLDVRSA